MRKNEGINKMDIKSCKSSVGKKKKGIFRKDFLCGQV